MPGIDFHQPVLLSEVIEGLNIQPSGIYIDGTFGRGGHTSAILKKADSNSRVIAVDKDNDAVKTAKKIIAHDRRLSIFQGSFNEIKKITDHENITGKVDGILLDLGVSSPQLDNAARGFSFLREGPLDMRMDTTTGLPLETLLAKIQETTLSKILKEYGEEKFAKRIAKAIILTRKTQQIKTTTQLADIVAKAHPAWSRGKHPATQTFQALRIFINHELDDLTAVLPQCLDILKIGGRLLVISFHSLEDRIVKRFIQQEIRGSTQKSFQKLPLRHTELNIKLRCIGRVIRPAAAEINQNPRAHSAMLRIVEKIK